mgnify:CR=1 FL=1|tara:strand:+ start:28136 stop:28711 length:576 start_codon:yes stop_codon:yes gene_type:complete
MRIISGTHKGRRLIAPKHLPVRPTTDFAKEGLFNILRNRLDFSTIDVLELFAGTGNISFEFASRGVPHITAVDSYRGCVQFIHKIAQEFDFPIETVTADVDQFLARNNKRFDLIFADPPYQFDAQSCADFSRKIWENNLLNDSGFLIIEHSKHTDLSQLLHFQEQRKYGGSVFSFFTNNTHDSKTPQNNQS